MLKVVKVSLRSIRRRGWLGFVLVLAAIFTVFLWHLGDLTPGLSPAEVSYANSSHSLSSIISDPLNAPHKLIQLGIFKLVPQHPSLLRLASVFFGLVFCVCFYRLATGWFGRAIGLFSTLIFGCLPLFVVSARQISPSIMFFSPIVFISLYAWLVRTKQSKPSAWIWLCVSGSILIYTPGLLIWMLVAFIICRRQLLSSIRSVSVPVTFFGLLCLFAALASLVLSSLRHHAVAKQLLLIPDTNSNLVAVIKHIGWMFSGLFIKTGQTEPLIVQRLPILSILTIALLIFGVYAMLGAAKTKALWLGLGVLYAIIAAGLNDNLELLALGLPQLIILAGAGLRYLYIEWRSVFPRNPVPRTFALILIAVVVLAQLYFGLRYSLSAWPNTPATRLTYVLK